MNEYKTLQTVALFTGEIGLTPFQAKRRSGKVKPVFGKPDTFEILEGIKFKAGETIRLSGVIPKVMRMSLAKIGADGEIMPLVDEKPTPKQAARKVRQTNKK
jgi:hypothetical protein